MKVTVVPIVIGALGTVTKGLIQGLEDLKIREYPNYTIIKIDQNIEKSPGDLRRFEETCYHSNPSGKPSAKADVKKLLKE